MKDLTLSEEELQDMLQDAAKKGAQHALHSIGLSDENAQDDLREMRSLVKAMRTVRKTALKAVIYRITDLAVTGGLILLVTRYGLNIKGVP